ncbi:helix-turn-helix transcriptional regulator [Methylobacterium sp.]|uniref:helix-turn-helix transcriptional regulator n=1 Tax=Methylobacterium sp. TaxID=409 RepID=UPI00351E503F
MQQSTTTGEVRPHDISIADRIVLRFADACGVAGVSINTMRRLVTAGRGPRVVRLSERRIGIRRSDLDAWIESRTSAA